MALRIFFGLFFSILLLNACRSGLPRESTLRSQPQASSIDQVRRNLASEIERRFGLPGEGQGPGSLLQMAELERNDQTLECFRAICGEETKNFTYSDALFRQNYERNYYTRESSLYQELDDLIRKSMKEEAKGKREEIALIEAFGAAQSFHVPEKIRFYINGFKLLSTWSKVFLHVIKTESSLMKNVKDVTELFYYEFSESQLIQAGVRPGDKGFFLKAQEQGITKMFGPKLVTHDKTLKQILNERYPGKEYGAQVKLLIGNCIAGLKKFADDFDIPMVLLEENYCVELSRNPNAPVNEAELKSNMSFSSLLEVFNQPNIKTFLNFPVDELELAEKTREILKSQQFSAWKSFVSGEFAYTEESENIITQCHAEIGASVEVLSSPVYRRNWQHWIQKIKSASVALVKFQDPMLQKAFEERVNKISFGFPPPRDLALANLSDSFRRMARDQSALSQMIFSKPEIRNRIGLFYVAIGMGSSLSEDIPSQGKLFEDLIDECKGQKSEALSDHIYTANGDAYLSWVSLNYPRVGIGIAAHEMGHYVSRILQDLGAKESGAFYLGLPAQIPVWEARQCVNKRYIPIRAKYGREWPWTEEDWSDLFAGKVLEQIRSQDMSWAENFACALTTDYLNIEYSRENKLDTNDPHSASLMRVIQVEALLKGGNLPKACQGLRETKKLCL